MLKSFMLRTFAMMVTLFAAIALFSVKAEAKPPFAMKEMKKCDYCHVNPGGPRNFRGLYYAKNKLSFADFDNTFEAKAAGVKPDSVGKDAVATNPKYPTVTVPAALNFTMKDIKGETVNLGRYSGDVILLVNTASKCGNTPQYDSLQKLYDKYKEKGFTVLAFPANDFGSQEPGTDKDILEFCKETYKVAFPLFSKTAVKGEAQNKLFKFLTSKETNAKFAGDIEWNFVKFLVNRKGEIVGRFGARVDPMKADVVKAIEKEIAMEKAEK